MCDYSLMHLKSRKAAKGDKLISSHPSAQKFGTKGLFSPEALDVAVCLLPGTEVAFEQAPVMFMGMKVWQSKDRVATFKQINKDQPCVHHDAFEFKDGEVQLVTNMVEGQKLTVLTLPAAPRSEAEEKAQERLPVLA